MDRVWPVAISTIGSASAATVVWRQGHERFVTAIVKGTFTFVPGGVMAAIAPDPILAEEQDGPPGRGLLAADDLAPYLGQADIALTGHAPAPRSPGAHAVRVRIALIRDGAAIVDKAIDLEVPASAQRIPIGGLGPISKRWPVRRNLLGGIDPRLLTGASLEIPASFDWRYFQASSGDLRAASLRGDEWILLEGVHPTIAQLMTQLPGARAEARLDGAPSPGGNRPIALTLDTVRLDVDRRRCSLTWRGRFPIHGDLSALRVVAGIALPGRPLVWPDPPEAQEEDEDALAGTLMIVDDLSIEEISSASDAAVEDLLAGTMGLDDSVSRAIDARPATPFRKDVWSPLAVSSGPVRAAPAQPAEDDDPLAGTMGLDALASAAIAARPATPFAGPPAAPARPFAQPPAAPAPSFAQAPAAPAMPFAQASVTPAMSLGPDPAAPPLPFEDAAVVEEDPLAGTMGLDDRAVAAIAERPATPFRSDIRSPLAVASYSPRPAPRAASEDDPLGGTMGLDEGLGAALDAQPIIPFQDDLPPIDPEEGKSISLGAHFLAAMAESARAERITRR